MGVNINKSTIFSVRIKSTRTSFSIKNKILAFYCAVNHEKGNIHDFINEEINDIVRKWEGEDFKGISDFVVGELLTSLLGKKQIKKYRKSLERLEI